MKVENQWPVIDLRIIGIMIYNSSSDSNDCYIWGRVCRHADINICLQGIIISLMIFL